MTLPKNKSVLIASGIAVVIALWLLSGIFNSDDDYQAKSVLEENQTTSAHVQVKELVAYDHPEIIKVFGQSDADRSVQIKAQTSGRISEVLIEKGAFVKEGDVIARIEIDDRQERLNSARAALRYRSLQFEASRKLSQKSFRSQTTLAENESLLNAARADLKKIQLDIAHTEIKAPFDGKLNSRDIEVGDYVETGSAIAQVVDLSPIVVKAAIAEKDILKISDGQQAMVSLAGSNKLNGIVRYVSAISEAQTRTYDIEIEIPNPDQSINAGLTSAVSLTVGSRPAYLISPAVLTLSEKGEVGVKLVDNENIVSFKKVQLIEDTAEGIWVSGLPEKITLIIRGQEYVTPGQTVLPVSKDQGDAS